MLEGRLRARRINGAEREPAQSKPLRHPEGIHSQGVTALRPPQLISADGSRRTILVQAAAAKPKEPIPLSQRRERGSDIKDSNADLSIKCCRFYPAAQVRLEVLEITIRRIEMCTKNRRQLVEPPPKWREMGWI
jgi:hypothetical protein